VVDSPVSLKVSGFQPESNMAPGDSADNRPTSITASV
jgi:hypothetical protein